MTNHAPFINTARRAAAAAAMSAALAAAMCISAAPPASKPAPKTQTSYLDYARQGHTAFDSRDYKSALELFNKSSGLNPSYMDATLYAGLSLMELDRCPEAMKKFDKVVSSSKDKNEVSTARGKRDECDPAMLPDDAFEQGEELLESKKYAEAAAMYRRILRAEPDNLRAMLFLGRGQCMSGDQERGRAALKQVLDRSRKAFELDNAQKYLDACESAEAAFDKGAAAFKDKDYERAAPLFERVLDEDPANAKALLYLGRSYCLTDRYDEGREKLEAAAAKATGISDTELAAAWIKSCKKSADLEAAEPAKAVGDNICLNAKITDNWSTEAVNRQWSAGWHAGSDLNLLTDGNPVSGVTSGFGGWGDNGDGMTLDVINALAATSANGGQGIPCVTLEIGQASEIARLVVTRQAQNGEGEGGHIMALSIWGSADGEQWTNLSDPFQLPPGGTLDISGAKIKNRLNAKYIRVNVHDLGLYKWGKKTNSQMGLSEIECYRAAAGK